MYGICPSPTASLREYTYQEISNVVALIPVHDEPFRQASIELLILSQSFAHRRADEIVQLLLGVAVNVCDAQELGTLLVDGSNNGSNRFPLVKSVVVGVISDDHDARLWEFG